LLFCRSSVYTELVNIIRKIIVAQNDNIDWHRYNGEDTTHVISFYNSELSKIYDIIKDIEPDNEELVASELSSYKYSHHTFRGRGSGYWIHSKLDVPNWRGNKASLLIKCAAINNLDLQSCKKHGILYNDDELRGKLGKLIYTVDKHDSVRHDRSECIVRQVSSFISYIEYKSTGRHSIRFQGSKDGRERNRTDNIPYLKLLSNGPDNVNNNLLCHVNGRLLTPYKLTNHTANKLVTVTDWEVHHILCKNNESVFKTDEPSYTLSAKNYKKFTHNTHLEMLGSIVLGVESHSALHDADKNDCIDYWFKRYENGECKSLPFHFISEENYIKTLSWLQANTDNFNIDIAPTYLEFKLMHSLTHLLNAP